MSVLYASFNTSYVPIAFWSIFQTFLTDMFLMFTLSCQQYLLAFEPNWQAYKQNEQPVMLLRLKLNYTIITVLLTIWW